MHQNGLAGVGQVLTLRSGVQNKAHSSYWVQMTIAGSGQRWDTSNVVGSELGSLGSKTVE